MSKTLFLILLHSFTVVHSGKLELHTNEGKVVVLGGDQCDSGAIFEQHYDFSCICVTGLWALYAESCESAIALVGGDGQCLPFDFMFAVRKANLLSAASTGNLSLSSTTAFDRDFKSIGGKFQSINGSSGKTYFVPPENPFILTTGMQSWRLPSKKKCMRPIKPDDITVMFYCIFDHGTEEEYRMEDGCLSGDEDLAPVVCADYYRDVDMKQADPKSCNFEKKIRVKRDEEDTTDDPVEDVEPIIDDAAIWTPEVGAEEDDLDEFSTEAPPPGTKKKEKSTGKGLGKGNTNKGKNNKGGPKGRTLLNANDDDDVADEHSDDSPSPGSRPQGRVFLSAVQALGNSTPPDNPLFNISKMDENHNLTVTLTHPKMNSELWNYMTMRAQDLLNIRSPKKDTLDSPAFIFLDICKQILQNVCPEHYVRKEHFDLSVGAFISLQRNHLQFVDSFVDFGTKERIQNALLDCLANKTEPYPFIERTPNGKPCPGQELIEHGQFQAFGTKIQAYMTATYSGLQQEPIIETVWKTFVHAHSACYGYFKDNLNDHHRFTTIMLNLFTNDISDIWLSVEPLKSDIYAGFLGDARDIITSIDYCTVFSRMESDYPWDLPRPGKNGAKSSARRKREVANEHKYECLHNMDARDICPSENGGWNNDEDISEIWGLDDPDDDEFTSIVGFTNEI